MLGCIMQETARPHFTDTVANRVQAQKEKASLTGRVKWAPVKSLWWTGMVVCWVSVGSIHFSWSAVSAFFVLTGITLCFGHSLGMHRRLIHQSYSAPKWLEYAFVYLGTLVGLGGPKTMMMTHDIRDWAQQTPQCHPYFSHQSPMLKDFGWQVHCQIHLDTPPEFMPPDHLRESRFYQWLEATSLLQQLPVGLVLFAVGGWGWVAWALCGRVAVSIFGHWIIGYFAHRQGERHYHVTGAAAQGFNVHHVALLTFGECWHNNHHAFPGSANFGLFEGEWDPGWTILKVLERARLVWDLNTPDDLPHREALLPLGEVA